MQNFAVYIDGEIDTEGQLKKKRVLVCRLILMSVSDDFIDLIAEHKDPAVVWKALKDQYYSGDQS